MSGDLVESGMWRKYIDSEWIQFRCDILVVPEMLILQFFL